MKKILGIVLCLTLFPKVAFAQDALCFMEWHGNVIDLSNSMCRSRTENYISTKLTLLSTSDIRLSDVQIEQASDGTSLEIKGTINNESNKLSSLSLVKFDVINQQNGRILTSDTVGIDAGAGIAPGEQIAFSKLIRRNIVGGNVKISDLRVEITGSI